MSNKLFFVRSLAVTAMVFAVATSAPPAHAAAAGTGAAPAARILIFDLRRAVVQSKVGQSIAQQVDGLKKQAQQELNAEAEALKREKARWTFRTPTSMPRSRRRRKTPGRRASWLSRSGCKDHGGLIQGGM